MTMRTPSLIFSIIFLASCSANGKSPAASGYMLPVCANGPASVGEKVWPTAAPFFGAPLGKSVCTEQVSSGLSIHTPLHIVPYKNGLADVEFGCDREEAGAFFVRNSGRLIAFVAGSKAVVTARIPERPFIDRCAILGQPSLKEAVAMCEAFAGSMKLDKEQCWKPCVPNDDKSWACIVHK